MLSKLVWSALRVTELYPAKLTVSMSHVREGANLQDAYSCKLLIVLLLSCIVVVIPLYLQLYNSTSTAVLYNTLIFFKK